MLRSIRRAAALFALTLVSGCYTGTVAYVAPHAAVRSDLARLLAVVQETASAQGLRVVRVVPDRGLVVALRSLDDTGALMTRERWSISVRADDVAVEMHPESKAEGEAAWARDSLVCDCYHYARERELLQAIRARLRRAAR